MTTEKQRIQEFYSRLLKTHRIERTDIKMTDHIDWFVKEITETADRAGLPAEELRRELEAYSQDTEARGLSAWQRYLDELSQHIEEGIKAEGIDFNIPVFVAEFPTGSFNAQAMRVASGVLILINEGLMMLIHQMSKILSFAIRLSGEAVEGRPPEGQRGVLLTTPEERLVAVIEVVEAYLVYGRSTVAQRFPAQVFSVQGLVSSQLRHYCEEFAVAHEYGHALAGHLDRSRSILKSTPAGDVTLIEKSWEEEFVADYIGARILLNAANISPEDEARKLELQNLAAAPLFFFALDDLITGVAAVVSGVPTMITDHPPSLSRLHLVRTYLVERLGEQQLELADAYVSWTLHMKDQILEAIAKQGEADTVGKAETES